MFVLTLVHGTWGRGIVYPSGDAPWTTDTSALCRSLRERFGQRVVFRRFQWSGRNSHTARFNAAAPLGAFLQEGLKEWPDATHVVVAHSHGGNVTLSALDAFSLRTRIAGVACLATPFLSARDRDIGQDPWRTFAGAILVLVAAVLWGLNMLAPGSWTSSVRLGFDVVVGSLLVSVFLLLARGARQHARRLHRELTPLAPTRDQLLIIRSPADEASGALALFQFTSQLTVRLFLLAQSWQAAFHALATRWAKHRRTVLLVGVAAFLVSFVMLVAYAEVSEPGSDRSWLAAGALAGWALSVLVFAATIYLALPFLGVEGVTMPFRLLVSAFVWPVILALSILVVVPFGWQAAVANILLDVTAENTPAGSWETHLIEPPTSEELGVPVPPLMHQVYENPHVHRLLGQWIEQRGSRV